MVAQSASAEPRQESRRQAPETASIAGTSRTTGPDEEWSEIELPSDALRFKAQQIVEMFKTQAAQGISPGNSHFRDVQESVAHFGFQIRLLEDASLGVPCLMTALADLIPVDLRGVGLSITKGSPKRSKLLDNMDRVTANLEKFTRNVSQTTGQVSVEMWPASVVNNAFTTKLTEFLTDRLHFLTGHQRGSKSPDNPSDDPVAGIKFRVNTKSRGLQVYYSPCYFFTPTVVFNAPSTPVYSWIQPGRYVFGAGRAGAPPIFDFAEYDVPPQTQAVLGI
jgi:hypothetical protein